MKIKTITCHDVYNSGASLQAYALMKYIQNLGHDVEIINYKPDYLSQHYKLFAINNPRYENNLVLKIIYLTLKFPERVLNLRIKRKFDKFKNENMNITKKIYRSNDDLIQNYSDADLFIAGSDQIWNTKFKNGKDPAFYLQFVPENRGRVSYAASFATDKIEEGFEHQVLIWLKTFNKISVREKSGLKILKDIGISDAIQVLDPVFLLNKKEWINLICDKKIKEKYILIYDFDSNETIKKIAKRIAKEKNLKIYSIQNLKYADKYLKYTGPKEFLTYIYNAEYVISNSFHATAYSLIFEKQFFVVNRKDSINTRMRDLLEEIGAIGQMIDIKTFEYENLPVINYEDIRKNIEHYTNLSKGYLNSILGGNY